MKLQNPNLTLVEHILSVQALLHHSMPTISHLKSANCAGEAFTLLPTAKNHASFEPEILIVTFRVPDGLEGWSFARLYVTNATPLHAMVK